MTGAPPVSPDHYLALVEAHRRFLGGDRTAPALAPLGPLAGLLVDGDGWRPDGTLRTHRALVAALDALVRAHDAGTFAMTVYGSRGTPRTIDTVRRALRVRWGIDALPVNDAVTPDPGGDPVSKGTMRSWERAVVACVASLECLAEHVPPERSDGPRRPRTGPRPMWESHASQWPPAPVRAAMLAAVGLAPDDDESLQVVRHATARALGTYLRDHTRATVHHAWWTRAAWFSEDARFADALVPDVEPTGRRSYTPGGTLDVRERVVVELVMRLVVADRPELVRLVRDQRASLRLHLDTSRSPTRLAIVRSLGTAGDQDRPPVGSAVQELIATALDVRAHGGAVREEMAAHYIERRAAIADHLPDYGIAVQRAVAAADNSVGVDVMRLGSGRLLTRLDALRRAAPRTASFVTSEAFVDRDEAQLIAKSGDLLRSLQTTARAVRGLRARQDVEDVDVRAFVEADEQIQLAMAGNLARLVETEICALGDRSRPARDEQVLRRFILAAEARADAAVALVTSLEPDLIRAADDPGRLARGHIATSEWTVRPRMIALRIRASTLLLRRVLRDPPKVLAPFRERLVATWEELLRDPGLTAAQAPELVQNAVLMAFVNDLSIPVVELPADPSRADAGDRMPPVYASATFLAGPPADEPSSTPGAVTVTEAVVNQARTFLAGHGFDNGRLAAMPTSARAAQFLTAEYGRLWTSWTQPTRGGS